MPAAGPTFEPPPGRHEALAPLILSLHPAPPPLTSGHSKLAFWGGAHFVESASEVRAKPEVMGVLATRRTMEGLCGSGGSGCSLIRSRSRTASLSGRRPEVLCLSVCWSVCWSVCLLDWLSVCLWRVKCQIKVRRRCSTAIKTWQETASFSDPYLCHKWDSLMAFCRYTRAISPSILSSLSQGVSGPSASTNPLFTFKSSLPPTGHLSRSREEWVLQGVAGVGAGGGSPAHPQRRLPPLRLPQAPMRPFLMLTLCPCARDPGTVAPLCDCGEWRSRR